MKAAIINQFGSPDVLQYTEIDRPAAQRDRVLIEVHASSVNPFDCKVRQGNYQFISGHKFPLLLGLDVAGEVVEIGEKVTNFKPGEAVYAFLPSIGGAYAEYVAVPEAYVCPKPKNLTYQQAAVVPLAATTALQALRDMGKIKRGQQVLINGASGGVGTFAVQIAKLWDAQVTGACSSKNVELVKQLGADRVIDYTQQDFIQEQEQYDIIFDAVSKRSFSECKRCLLPQGIYITLLPSFDAIANRLLTFFSLGKKATFFLAQPNSQDLASLKEWIEAGRIRPIIDRTYPLSEIASAHAYSETGRAAGKIAIAILKA